MQQLFEQDFLPPLGPYTATSVSCFTQVLTVAAQGTEAQARTSCDL